MKQENGIFAHNIKSLRKKYGETQEEFSRRFGSNKKAVWTYESGFAKPGSKVLLALAEEVGIDPEVLMTTKLKISASGKIINLPVADKQLQEFRSELKRITTDFDKAVKVLFRDLEKLNNKLDKLEKSAAKKTGTPRNPLPAQTKTQTKPQKIR